MLIEHSFVTTLPVPQVMAQTSAMLGKYGFVSETAGAFQMDQPQWTRLQMRRGAANVRRAKDMTQCPQRVIVEWDRGRVTVAAALEPRVIRRSFAISSATSAFATMGKKQSKQAAELMTALVESVEFLLVDRMSEDDATRRWREVEATRIEAGRKARRRSIIFLIVFFLVIVGLIVLAVVTSKH